MKIKLGNATQYLPMAKISAPVETLNEVLKYVKYDVVSVEEANHSMLQYLVQADSINLTHVLLDKTSREVINFQNEDGDTILHIAARNKNDLMCTSLICSSKINMNIVNKEGKNVLHVASEVGCLRAVKMFMMQQTLDINVRDYLNFTPLHYALLNGHEEVALLLLTDPKVNLSMETYRKESGYHLAFAKNCSEVIRKYVSKESLKDLDFVNNVTIYGNTILHHINSLILIDKIWDIVKHHMDKTNYRSQSPIYYACARKNVSIFRYLIQKQGCQTFENAKESLLHMAIRKNSKEMVTILSKCHNGNEINKFNINCLEAAAIYGCDETASTIGKNLVGDDWRDYRNELNENTLSHYAAIGIRSIAQMKSFNLSKDNENFFKSNKYGMSPYLYLILYGKVEIVKHVIDMLDKQNKCDTLYRVNLVSGNTAVHYAVKSGNHEMLSLIVNHLKAHANMPNYNHKTPLNLASTKNDPLMVKILLKTFKQMQFVMSPDDRSLIDCIENNPEPNIILLSKLLDAGCNINHVEDHTTALLLAIEGQKEKVVKFLLRRNANIFFPVEYLTKEERNFQFIKKKSATSYLRSLLHVAVENENVEITRDLLTYGAIKKINRRDTFGLTPLHHALMNQHYDQISLLLSHGANCDVLIRSTGDTLLHLAARIGNLDIVKLLLKYDQKVCYNFKAQSASLIAYTSSIDVCNLLMSYEHDADRRIRNRMYRNSHD